MMGKLVYCIVSGIVIGVFADWLIIKMRASLLIYETEQTLAYINGSR